MPVWRITTRAQALLSRLTGPQPRGDVPELRYWQERIIAAILLVGVALSIVVYPPSIWLSVRENLPQIVIADTLVLAAMIVLLMLRRIPF